MRLSEYALACRSIALGYIAVWSIAGTLVRQASAQVVQAASFSCLDDGDLGPSNQLLNFSNWYAQFDTGQSQAGQQGQDAANATLRLVGFGVTGEESTGFSSETGFLATIIASSSVVSFNTWSNNSALCDAITAPDASRNLSSPNGCPFGPGEFALGLDVPLSNAYPFTTLLTQIRILDTSSPSKELACVQISTSPFYPDFWAYKLILWATVAISLLAGVVTWFGRVWAAYTASISQREAELASSLTTKLSPLGIRERLGPAFWDAASGATLQNSASLRRFATPGLRECVWAAQFVVLIGMIGVEWPSFAYPAIAKTAWSFLLFNTTLAVDLNELSDPLQSTSPATLPSTFSSQLRNPASTIYLDSALPNTLLGLGEVDDGVALLARSIGLPAASLFPSFAAFFAICLAFVTILSIVLCAFDFIMAKLSRNRLASSNRHGLRNSNASTSRTTLGADDGFYNKDDAELKSGRLSAMGINDGEDGQVPVVRHTDSSRPLTNSDSMWSDKQDGHTGGALLSVPTMFRIQYHLRLLAGNVVRLITLFHLPLVTLSAYQFTLLNNGSTTGAFAGAVLTFAILGVALPAFCIWTIYRLHEPVLQEDLPTLLFLGTLYNVFGDRSYSFMGVRFLGNLVVGLTVGAAQSSDTAQAIVLLVVEVADTLITSLWLPWGEGAMMGPLAFLFSVARVISAVLLIVLTSAVDISRVTAGWLAYVILAVQAIVFLILFLVAATKLIELVVRGLGHVPFDETRSLRAGGLTGAIRRWDRSGRKRRHQRHGRNTSAASRRALRSAGTQSEQDHLQRHQSDLRSRHTSSFYDDYPRAFNPESNQNAVDDDGGYIMSAMSDNHWQSASYPAYVKDENSQQRLPARSPSWHTNNSLELPAAFGDTNPGKSSFTVVRGGKATDEAPFTMSARAGESHLGGRRGPGADSAGIMPLGYDYQMQQPPPSQQQSHYSRPSASSADYFDHGHNPRAPSFGSYSARPAPNLFSNANRSSSGGLHGRQSSGELETPQTKKRGRIFGRLLGKDRLPEEAIESSDEDDDDDEDVESLDVMAKSSGRSLWPFRKKESEPEEPVPAPSFAVVRKPRQTPSSQPSPSHDV